MESLFVECAVRAVLIAVVTAVVLRMIGIKPAAARHTAWTSVMLTMLSAPRSGRYGDRKAADPLAAACGSGTEASEREASRPATRRCKMSFLFPPA